MTELSTDYIPRPYAKTVSIQFADGTLQVHQHQFEKNKNCSRIAALLNREELCPCPKYPARSDNIIAQYLYTGTHEHHDVLAGDSGDLRERAELEFRTNLTLHVLARGRPDLGTLDDEAKAQIELRRKDLGNIDALIVIKETCQSAADIDAEGSDDDDAWLRTLARSLRSTLVVPEPQISKISVVRNCFDAFMRDDDDVDDDEDGERVFWERLTRRSMENVVQLRDGMVELEVQRRTKGRLSVKDKVRLDELLGKCGHIGAEDGVEG